MLQSSGKKRFRFSKTKVFAIVCAGALLVWFALPSSVPTYESRSLNYWVKELPLTIPQSIGDNVAFMETTSITVDGFRFGALDPEETRYAYKAFHAVGTNALPFLLRELQQTDGYGKPFVRTLFKKLGHSTPRAFQPAKPKRYQAVTAMRLLGTNLTMVRPALEKLSSSKDKDTRMIGTLLLQSLSTNGVAR